jgi:hypothetical protein
VEDHGLGRSAGWVLGIVAVEPVLVDVEVEAREIHRAEVEDAMRQRGQLVRLKGLGNLVSKPPHRSQHIDIEAGQFALGDCILFRVEIGEVAEKEPQGVADLPIGLGVACHDFFGDTDVFAEIDHRGPEPQDVGAVLREELARSDHVAHRFGHLASLGVDDEAVGHDLPKRGRALETDRGHERGLKPPAVLVLALEVEIGRPVEAVAVSVADREMADSGVEPDVEDVSFLTECGRAAGPAGVSRR